MKYSILLFLTLIVYIIPVQAQETAISWRATSFADSINHYNYLYSQEKVYLHFDNTNYFVGDTIWFKAYVVFAKNHKPESLSKILYVELLSPAGEILETRKLKIEDGQCHGDFSLGRNIQSGFYEIRSYTRAMLNWDTTSIFSRVFPVYSNSDVGVNKYIMDSDLLKTRKEKKLQKKINMSFFPEGGNLVKGVPSRVAFKIVDENGCSISAKGNILNNDNQVITSFITRHQGMGDFTIVPDYSNMQAHIEYEGKEYLFPLPEALSKGYVMSLNTLIDGDLYVQIYNNDLSLIDTLGLTVMCRGDVSIAETIVINEGKMKLKIPKADLVSGVNQITLFNKIGEIFSERLFFIPPIKQVNIISNLKDGKLFPFEPVNIDFFVSDEKGIPLNRTFSLAVRDAQTDISTCYSENMATYFLLSSDLKGYIENPAYYFESDDLAHKQALDLLMLTQGWRRYSWQKMCRPSSFKVNHPIEEHFLIRGQVLSPFRKKEKGNMKVLTFVYPEKFHPLKGKCNTDSDGYFNFSLPDMYGTADVSIVLPEQKKYKNNQIVLDRIFSPQPRSYSYYDTYVKIAGNNVLNDSSQNITSISDIQVLSEVIVRGEKKTGRSDIIYNVEEDIERLKDIGKDYPQTVEKYLSMKDRKFEYHFDPDYEEEYWEYDRKPVLMVRFGDEHHAYRKGDHSKTFYRSVSEIQKIIVKSDRYLWHRYDPELQDLGREAITIFLYPYKPPRFEQKGIRNTRIDVFYQAKEFYNPQYPDGPIPGDVDARRTLYWNPNVKTDNNGKASVRFYNNSNCKELIIDAESF